MLTSQKLSLRTSELRQRLNHLSNQDELADGESAEITRLSTEFADVESRFRAAVIGESREEAERSTEFTTATGKVRRFATCWIRRNCPII